MIGTVVWKTARNVPNIAAGAAIGAVGWSRFVVDHDVECGPSLVADRFHEPDGGDGTVAVYHDTSGSGSPVLLVHSVNAAASAYEMKPLFEAVGGVRPVYALDLPGYGLSTRGDRTYTPQLMATAIESVLKRIGEPTHVVALSLGSEFAVRASMGEPRLVASLTLISPTGFGAPRPRNSNAGGFLRNPAWSQAIYDVIVSRPSIRYFLSKSFSGPVDDGLVDHAFRTAHRPGARHAPIAFLAGELFSPDAVDLLYRHVEAPTMVVHDRDPFTSFVRLPELVSERAAHWSVRRIEGTLGLPQWDQPVATGAILESFWTSVTGLTN